MKAQRRHELQESDLAKVIKKAPTFWQESGSKFLAFCVALLVIVVLIRYRISSNRVAEAQALDNLASARNVITQLHQLRGIASIGPGELVAQQQRQLFNDANNLIGNAIGISDERKVQAEALIAKGDLNYALASMAPVQGAATQPTLMIKDPKALLESAGEAYRTVLNNYSDEKYSVIAARFALAAIAEDRRDFDAAKQQYDQIVLETKDMPAYQQMASLRLNMLDVLKNPPLFGKPTTVPALAEMLPATLPTGIAAPTSVPTTSVVASAKPQAAATTAPTSQPR
jgi:predicted negative regulator of RcsB-dependent stress response